MPTPPAGPGGGDAASTAENNGAGATTAGGAAGDVVSALGADSPLAAVRREFDKLAKRQLASSAKVRADVEQVLRELALAQTMLEGVDGTTATRAHRKRRGRWSRHAKHHSERAALGSNTALGTAPEPVTLAPVHKRMKTALEDASAEQKEMLTAQARFGKLIEKVRARCV